MIRKVLKLNDSKMIVIPKPVCDEEGIEFGDLLRVNIIKVIKGEMNGEERDNGISEKEGSDKA